MATAFPVRQRGAANSGSRKEQGQGQGPVIVTRAAAASSHLLDSSSSSPSAGRSPPPCRRENLIRQPSYCKILNDLKGTEASVISMKSEQPDPLSEQDEQHHASGSLSSQHQVQTITINGQQYQIVSPSEAVSPGGTTTTSAASSGNAGVLQYAATTQNGQTVFIPSNMTAASSQSAAGSPVIAVTASPGSPPSSGHIVASGEVITRSTEEAARKREIRLLKNREAARECRNKKKEYIKCLENRVAVLENQNKALIEELKSLKELYTGQKN